MQSYSMPTPHTTAQAVILANGDFPVHPIPYTILQNNQDKLICCDGAANSLSGHNITPKTIIGDGDSLSSDNKIKYEHIFTKIPDQNTNDLTKAILLCQKNKINSILILGATGKREDHTIANIALLANYLSIIDNITMITDHGVFNAIQHPSKFQSHPGQQVSLFSMTPTPITSHHLKYEINQQSHHYWWQGSLNESMADHFIIEVNNPLIIYRVFDEKEHSESAQ